MMDIFPSLARIWVDYLCIINPLVIFLYIILIGQWLSLIGLNGSGKSTLVKLIDGLLPKTSGQIIIDKIGIVFQNPKDQFVGATVKDEVAFGLENQQKALSLVGMRSYYNSLLNNLSGGQQQRIAIADVIAVRPRIIILDEGISMLDPEARDNIVHLDRALKRRFNLTIIDVTHNLSDTKYAQRIAIMNKGKLFSSSALFQKLHLGLPDPDILRDLLDKHGMKVPNRHFSETGMLAWLHRLFLKR
ncbi:MAG: Hypothetical protein AJITA_00267 [Acetilactobacillus jinshanensis]